MFLVTGGAGFIGEAVVKALIRGGHQVRILDMRVPAYLEHTRGISDSVDFMRGDVTYVPELKRAMSGVHCIVHLAAHLLLSGDGPEMARVNVQGTQRVLKTARDCGVAKVVYTSTGMLYGPSGERPTLETDPPAPSGSYGRSKLEAEKICLRFLNEGFDLAILRPLFVIGRGRLGVLHLLFDRVARGRPIYLVGGGHNRFHMIGVDDLASAIVAASEPGRTGIFNLGVNDPLPVRSLMAALCDHAGTRCAVRPLPPALVAAGIRILSRLGLAPIEDEHQKVASQDRVLDTTRAHDILGWHPTSSDIELLIDTFEWYKDAQRGPRDYHSDWPDGGLLGWQWVDRII